MCPKFEQNTYIQGDYFEEQFAYIRLRIYGCQGEDCIYSFQNYHIHQLFFYLPELVVNYDSELVEEAVTWDMQATEIPLKWDEHRN